MSRRTQTFGCACSAIGILVRVASAADARPCSIAGLHLACSTVHALYAASQRIIARGARERTSRTRRSVVVLTSSTVCAAARTDTRVCARLACGASRSTRAGKLTRSAFLADRAAGCGELASLASRTAIAFPCAILKLPRVAVHARSRAEIVWLEFAGAARCANTIVALRRVRCHTFACLAERR